MLYQVNCISTSYLLIGCVILFALSGLLQLYFYFHFFLAFGRSKPENKKNKKLPLSLIIAFRNEVKQLKAILPLLLNQNHDQFELILVDDGSEDGSFQLLESFQDERIKLYQLKQTSGKKAAIEKGIKEANYDHLVFTDADCYPNSVDWLSFMAGGFSQTKKIVLGHGRFFKTSGLLNQIMRYESFWVATQYFSFAHKGIPYMGVGRNLAYHRSVYEGSSSFSKFKNLRSGDDDLLVNEMANEQNVALVTKEQSHTFSKSAANWKEYFYQKRRQLQAGVKYKFRHRLWLAANGLSSLLFNILALILFLISDFWLIILITFVIISIIKSLILKKVSNILGEKDLMPQLFLLEFIHILMMTIIGISTWIWRVNKWK